MRALETLMETVLAVRKRSFPELPADLVEAIVTIEASSHEDRLHAREEASAAINAHLKATTSP